MSDIKLPRMSRRGFIVSSSAAALAKPDTSLAKTTKIDFAAIEQQTGGRLGFIALDVRSGNSIDWRADQRFPFCSSFKALLAAFVLWKADLGELNLNNLVRYGASDLLPCAPSTRAHLTSGAMSISALCKAVVELSDNTAANLLLRKTGGPAALTAWMRSQGDDAFNLTSNEPSLNLSRYGDARNTTTPAAMTNSYRRFIEGDTLSPPSQKLLTNWLVTGKTGCKRLRAGLPARWVVGDKTGTYTGDWFSVVDVAIGWPPETSPIVSSAFFTGTRDVEPAEQAMVELSRAVAMWRTTLPVG